MKIPVKNLDKRTFLICRYLKNGSVEEIEIEAKDKQEAIKQVLEHFEIDVFEIEK